MTAREREKQIHDTLVQQRDTQIVQQVIEMLEIRYDMHKECLVKNNDELLRGRAQECRELLKYIRGNGD